MKIVIQLLSFAIWSHHHKGFFGERWIRNLGEDLENVLIDITLVTHNYLRLWSLLCQLHQISLFKLPIHFSSFRRSSLSVLRHERPLFSGLNWKCTWDVFMDSLECFTTEKYRKIRSSLFYVNYVLEFAKVFFIIATTIDVNIHLIVEGFQVISDNP